MKELKFKYDRFNISVCWSCNFMYYLLYAPCVETCCVSVWLAPYFLLSTYTEPYFLSFLSMEYFLSNVNRLVFDRQLTGVKS